MLLEFNCSNHKSILHPVAFSMIAGADNHLLDKTREFDKGRSLRSAVIYGANGSGKSTLVEAIGFMKSLIVNSINHQPGQFILQKPHKLDKTWVSSYSLQFVADGVRYSYGFTIDHGYVAEEHLNYYPNKRQTRIFERQGEEFKTGYNFRGKLNTCKDVLKPNRLLLSCAANFSKVEEIERAFKYIDDKIVIYDSSVQGNWMNYALSMIHDDTDKKEKAIRLLNELGVPARDIEVKIEEKPASETGMKVPKFFAENIRQQIMQGNVKITTARVVYDNFSVDLNEESTGVKKMFAFLLPFIDVADKHGVLICDELEQGFHEHAMAKLVQMLIDSDKMDLQLIFNTHNTGILSLETFRRDQIWFTEMDPKDRSTALYSLADRNGVRKEDNFGKSYLMGKYGAIPMLNSEFIDSVDKKN